MRTPLPLRWLVLALLCGLRTCKSETTTTTTTTTSSSSSTPSPNATTITTSPSPVPATTMSPSTAPDATASTTSESTNATSPTTSMESSSTSGSATTDTAASSTAPMPTSSEGNNTTPEMHTSSVTTATGSNVTEVTNSTAPSSPSSHVTSTTEATTSMETTTPRVIQLGQACNSTPQCSTPQAICRMKVCRCDAGHYPSSFGGEPLSCRPVKELLPNELYIGDADVTADSITLHWRHSPYWQHRETENAWYTLTLGEAESQGEERSVRVTNQDHSFHGLSSSTTYIVWLQATVVEGGLEKQTLSGRRNHATTKINIQQIVIPILVLICIVLLLLLIYMKRRWLCGKVETLARRARSGDDGVQLQRVLSLPSSRPLLLSSLKESVHNMHKDSDRIFLHIFDELKQSSPPADNGAATSPNNAAKNRYNDVLPYDHSRVKLPVTSEDVTESDYINASFIPGFHGDKQFITTQGPLEGTVDDFWRMVWDQRSPVIVMLTELVEKSKVKCHCYWPVEQESSMVSGDITIDNISTSDLGSYRLTIFRLKKEEETLMVKHFHCNKWPDYSSVSPSLLVELVEKVQDYSTPDMPPVIVHCSAGVGRSGTFIAVDYLLHDVQDKTLQDSIDIYAFVLRMRRNRPLMVQTHEQFALIHDCAVLLAERKRQAELDKVSTSGSNDNLNMTSLPEDKADSPASRPTSRSEETQPEGKTEAQALGMTNGDVPHSPDNEAPPDKDGSATDVQGDGGQEPSPTQQQQQQQQQPQEGEGKTPEEEEKDSGDAPAKEGDSADGDSPGEDAASFHTIDLHSHEGSTNDVTGSKKDLIKE